MLLLAELFPDSDYRFHLTLRRGDPAEFFRRRESSGRLLAERARWLASEPARYAALAPGSEPLMDEFALACSEWGGFAGEVPVLAGSSGTVPRGAEMAAALGASIEPDFALLSADEAGAFRLRGGAVCFPTGWALEEKLGQTLDFIHGVVPGLNSALGPPIQRLLSSLTPGTAFLRSNWGLASTDELNLHPARRWPAPALPIALDRLWLRVEHQALVALPRTQSLVFGIRIALHRMDGVTADPLVVAGLSRALASMSDALAEYKGLTAIRPALLEFLRFR
jgi:hypothetical protein